MTGYGTARTQFKTINIESSLRAVNGRFLEIRFHIPREYIPLENDLKKMIAQTISRGTVDVFISRKVVKAKANKKIDLNLNLAKEYNKTISQLAKELKIKNTLSLDKLIDLPDVLNIDDSVEVSKAEAQFVKKMFQLTIKRCDEERKREGAELAKHLQSILNDLQKQLKSILNSKEKANKMIQERLEAKIKQRFSEESDQQRMHQELLYMLDKSDINEEVQRLQTHFENYKKMIQQESSEGKKLDFYTQELLREVNTIGSKSQVAEITQAVVEAKTLIERLREQVQNAE